MIKRIIKRIAETDYVRHAMAEQADLSALKKKPTPRIVTGLAIMAFSYIIGWPAVGGLGVLSVYFNKPLILAIGGPAIYGLSHLVFILGVYLAGATYVRVLFRWLTRIGMQKLLTWFPVAISEPEPTHSPETSKTV